MYVIIVKDDNFQLVTQAYSAYSHVEKIVFIFVQARTMET